MKTAVIGTLASVAMAADSTSTFQRLQAASPYYFREEAQPTYRGEQVANTAPYGDSVNQYWRDPDLTRETPRGAGPFKGNEPAPTGGAPNRTGDELILKSIRDQRTPAPERV